MKKAKIGDLESWIAEPLINRGFQSDEELSPEEILTQFCNWHGLINWGPSLIKVVRNADKNAK